MRTSSVFLICCLTALTTAQGSFFNDVGQTIQNVGSTVQNVAQDVNSFANTLGQVFNFDQQLAQQQGAGPVRVKTVRALRYALLPDESGGPPLFQSYALANGAVLKLYQPEPQHIVIAFGGGPLQPDSLAQQGSVPVPFLTSLLPSPQAPSVLVQTFSQLHSGAATEGPLAEAIRVMLAGNPAAAVTCTGDGVGGGLAFLCGPWAALQMPEATVSVITFGAPWTGFNEQFSWVLYRFVTLKYLWPFAIAAVPGPVTLQTQPQDVMNAVSQVITADTLKQAVAVPNVPSTPLTGNLGAPQPVNPQPTACPFIICKTKPWLAASCLAFDNANNATALPPNLKTIPVPGATGSDGAVVVAWDDATTTALLIWASTDSYLDWLSNVLFFNKGGFEPNAQLAALVPGAEVHQGFLNLFLAQVAPSRTSQTNLTALVYQLSGGKQPTRVITSGQSLGGALASLTGVWASATWPTATVLVTTSGQPKVGNQAYLDLVAATVGLEHRYVYNNDVVPTLPPDADYVQAPAGLWMRQGSILMQERPEIPVTELSWEDHHCESGYLPALQNSTTVSVPGWVGQNPAPPPVNAAAGSG